MEKACVAACGGDEELAAEDAHAIFACAMDDEKMAEIRLDFVEAINAETRKHELEKYTKAARAETVAYYTGYNTVRQRTEQKRFTIMSDCMQIRNRN